MNTLSGQPLRTLGGWRALDGYEERDEAELLRAGLGGDAAALERLLSRFERPLYVLCLGMLRHAEDAEDAVQETFLRALRSLRSYRAQSSLRTWLSRVAVNVCLERRRKPAPAERLDPALPSRQPALDAEAIGRLQALDALQSLHPRPRAVLLLKEVEGWTAAEIAAMLRCTERRVYHELRMAHRALAEWRKRHLDEGDLP